MHKSVTRHFLVRGERRRNGLIIVDSKTGNEIRIRIHRGSGPDTLRLAIQAAEDVLVYREEGTSS